MSDQVSNIVVLPATWTFSVGDIIIPQDPAGTAIYTIIDRSSDVSGQGSYRVDGTAGDPPEAVQGWIEKLSLEAVMKQASTTTVAHADPGVVPEDFNG